MTADSTMPILVVDDYQTMVRIICNLLKQIGYENVDTASNGAQALERIAEKKYGLIISDWNMQPMTGFELLVKLKGEPEHADIPFIMVTAESKTDNVIAARNKARQDPPLSSPPCAAMWPANSVMKSKCPTN